MVFLEKKINLDITDKIVTLETLYCVVNFIPYSKYLRFSAKYLELKTRKVMVGNLRHD